MSTKADQSPPLREGYTTGSSMTAAAKAAAVSILTGSTPSEMDIPLPVEGRLIIPIKKYAVIEDSPSGITTVQVTVVKDGGDDPDATHGSDMCATVRLTKLPAGSESTITLTAGTGIGMVTMPGLSVKPGNPAINPAPRRQILAAIQEVLDAQPLPYTVQVHLEVPDGANIAKNTMNARLGIIGGISILGTQGIVKPYSNDSYRASISQALDVAKALHNSCAVFTTGRRSERLYEELFTEDNDVRQGSFTVQCADFFEYAIQEGTKRGFKTLGWSLFFGKLVKHAMGFSYTHAKGRPIDFTLLSNWAKDSGVPDDICTEIEGANTARQVLTMVDTLPCYLPFVQTLIEKAIKNAKSFTRISPETTSPKLFYAVFDFDGRLINTDILNHVASLSKDWSSRSGDKE
ncbi:MAG: cobalt-precorrin-5B (C(1))-methyltransferase CbiD [Desulfovibrio sp.]